MARGTSAARIKVILTFSSSNLLRHAPLWGALFVGALLVRCNSADGDFGGSENYSGNVAGANSGASLDDVIGGDGTGGDSSASMLNPLCGPGECIPDSPFSCSGMGGMGGEDAMMGAAGGVNLGSGDLGGGGKSCQVMISPECEGDACFAERICAPAGASVAGEPCVAASDCSPGLACVGDSVSGVCRPVCCAGTEASCGAESYCDKRRLLETPELYVPVCLPVDDCPLTDPFPCSSGKDCACSDNKACIVVRQDGATACTSPGTGQAGDQCSGSETAECAHGFVCSPAAGACMKLCSTVNQDEECPSGGTCQSPSAFPADLGLCVGSGNGSNATK